MKVKKISTRLPERAGLTEIVNPIDTIKRYNIRSE